MVLKNRWQQAIAAAITSLLVACSSAPRTVAGAGGGTIPPSIPAPPRDSSPTAPSTTTDPAPAIQAAHRFITLWAQHIPQPGWSAQLAPYATPDLARRLTTVDPANVPATRVSTATQLDGSGQGGATVEVDTDSGWIVVDVIHTDNGWLIADIRPRP